MSWCRQATSHYLIQCWLRFISPYGVTRPQGVKPLPELMIFTNEVDTFATYCHCGVWCRGLTPCLLYVGPLFGNLFKMIVGLYVWHNGEQRFHCFRLCFTYFLMLHSMIIFCVRLPYFHGSNSALCFTQYISTLILHRPSLDTLYLEGKQRKRVWLYI